jgi:hypothetical protein
MPFRFEERPYAGKTFRPTPEIHLDPESGLLIVATPWGARSSGRRAIERMVDFLALARSDSEATSPFPRMSCLSTQANNLRIAAFLANETLYREDNREEYRSGVEIFAGILDENEFVWLQVGNPQILLSRTSRSLLPLGSQMDLAFDLSGSEIMPALPAKLLGLDSSLNVTINSFRAQPGDRLALLSHSYVPESIYGFKNDDVTIDKISRQLANEQPDLAFWLGLLNIEPPDLETL